MIKVCVIRFVWVMGLGYWRDVLSEGVVGTLHYAVLPFMVIQWGRLKKMESDSENV